MTERMFRIILGVALLTLLYISAVNNNDELIKFYIGILLFEGITNWRVPKLLTMLKNRIYYPLEQHRQISEQVSNHYRINFEAERAIRLVIALLLSIPVIFPVDILWIIPWFVGSLLLLAGMTNICPLGILLHWLGFK